ncbi:hypothetical protein BC829DRAFT_398642 [Chytridium lagenaria]|nr:hypothetical protein BC829DRAFT_398642 [Chytridium lagenaria]
MSSRDALEFDKELHSLYETKLPISASKIQQLTRLALKHSRHYKNVVYSIEKFVQKCSVDLKLAGLYVIDSIARASQKSAIGEGSSASLEAFAYLARLEEKIEGIFPHLLAASDHDKEKMKKVLGIWKKSNLSADTSTSIRSSGSRRDPRRPKQDGPEPSTTPPGSPPPLKAPPSAPTQAPTPTAAPGIPGLDPVAILTSLSTVAGGVLAPFLPSFLALLGSLQSVVANAAQDPAAVAALVATLGGGAGNAPVASVAPVASAAPVSGMLGGVQTSTGMMPTVLGDFDYSDDEDDGAPKRPKPITAVAPVPVAPVASTG